MSEEAIKRAANEAAPGAKIARNDGDLLVYYSGFNLSKFVRFLALQPVVVAQGATTNAAKLVENLLQAAVDYERADKFNAKYYRQELSGARAAVEKALACRLAEIATTKSALGFSSSQDWRPERKPDSNAASPGADTSKVEAERNQPLIEGRDQLPKILRYYGRQEYADSSNETVRVKAVLLTTAADEIEQLSCRSPADSDTIAVPRWWIEHTIKCLSGSLPSGHIGDCVFLLRDQLRDMLDRPSQPVTATEEDVAAEIYAAEYDRETYPFADRHPDERLTYLIQAKALLSKFSVTRKSAVTSTVLPSAEDVQ